MSGEAPAVEPTQGMGIKTEYFRMSDEADKILAALLEVQKEIEPATMDALNTFFKKEGQPTPYASLNSVMDTALPLLNEKGILVIQSPGGTERGVCMHTCLIHVESKQWVDSTIWCAPSKQDAQGMGAVITYLRRYALGALLGMTAEEDDDGETAVGRGKTKKPRGEGMPSAAPPPVLVDEKPHAIKVPILPDNSGSDWMAFVTAFAAAIHDTKTADDVKAWVAENEASLQGLRIACEQKKKKTHSNLMAMVTARSIELQQAAQPSEGMPKAVKAK